jgi:hypothetical protein
MGSASPNFRRRVIVSQALGDSPFPLWIKGFFLPAKLDGIATHAMRLTLD